MVYDRIMPITQKAIEAASTARRLKRLRRLAEELRAAGWKVEEPK